MSTALPIPPSCKTCAYFGKCFGTVGRDYATDGHAHAHPVASYPLGGENWQTRVLDSGGAGRPVLFLHGAGGHAGRFRYNLAHAAELGARALALDLPGHGFATARTFTPSREAYVAFVVEAITALGLPRIDLVGHGLGGEIAAALAVARPDLIEHLVLVAPTGIATVPPEQLELLSRIAVSRSPEGARERLRRSVYNPRTVDSEMAVEDHAMRTLPGRLVETTALTRFLAEPRAAVQPPLVPTLLLWGSEDRLLPAAYAEATAARLDDPATAIIPTTGNLPFLERPVLFNRLLAAFMDAGRIDARTLSELIPQPAAA